jgi:hypothetical protein
MEEWKKMHDKELHNALSSPNAISLSIRWAEHGAK